MKEGETDRLKALLPRTGVVSTDSGLVVQNQDASIFPLNLTDFRFVVLIQPTRTSLLGRIHTASGTLLGGTTDLSTTIGGQESVGMSLSR